MEEQDFINALMTSSKLQNSPVAFLAGLLKSFFSGEIDEATFKNAFEDDSCQSKMYLIYMPKDFIKANQIIFRNEFYLADRTNHAIYEYKLRGQEFKDALKKYILEYNEGNVHEKSFNEG